jgi:hypothetical protein
MSMFAATRTIVVAVHEAGKSAWKIGGIALDSTQANRLCIMESKAVQSPANIDHHAQTRLS